MLCSVMNPVRGHGGVGWRDRVGGTPALSGQTDSKPQAQAVQVGDSSTVNKLHMLQEESQGHYFHTNP